MRVLLSERRGLNQLLPARCNQVALAMAISLAGCAGDPTPPAEYPAIEAPPAAAASAAATPEPTATVPATVVPPPAPVQVVAGENTPLEGAPPTLHIKTPHDGALIKTETVEVTFDVKNWPLTPDGNHIHLIVDNEPYIAVRDVTKPIELRALVQKELGHELAEGTHVLRAFPGRGHHESVKEAGAFDQRTFSFKTKSADFKFDPKAPLLTFSRPKGCVDLGARALLDFYVINAKLGAADYRVRYAIDGTLGGDIVSWAPHYIENLPEGEHKIELILHDANGAPAPGPFNDTTRTFRVAKDCKAPSTAAPTAASTLPATPAATSPVPATKAATPPPTTLPAATAPAGH
jgi:hypothetical protein